MLRKFLFLLGIMSCCSVLSSWSREYCFSKNFSRDADDCVVPSNAMFVLCKSVQKEANYVQCTLLLKLVHTLRKPFSIFVFTKQQYNGTVLNSTHTFKYHNQKMNLLLSTKSIVLVSVTMYFEKKLTVCKTAKT